MVAQLAATPIESSASPASAVKAELQKLREYSFRLNQALEAERAKSSKLRQYIARINNARPQPAPTPPAPQNSDLAMQSLVEDQTRLLEQLYSENQKQQSELNELETKVQQLLTANDKLKARNIELRRRLKPLQEADTALVQSPTPPDIKIMEKPKAIPPIEQASNEAEIPLALRWFRFALNKG